MQTYTNGSLVKLAYNTKIKYLSYAIVILANSNMLDHIVELQHRLDEVNERVGRIKSYAASVKCQKNVESLTKIGLTSEDISYSLSVPLALVKSHKARIAKADEDRRRFLRTGILPQFEMPGRPAVYTIFQK